MGRVAKDLGFCVCHPYPKSVKIGPVRVTPEAHKALQGAGTWESLQKVPSFHSTLSFPSPPFCRPTHPSATPSYVCNQPSIPVPKGTAQLLPPPPGSWCGSFQG